MVEDMLYVDILEKAASCDSSLEELAYLAIYSCSVYGTTAVSARVGKPFNPMLGETYECDRRAECGWRVFMEQVCCQQEENLTLSTSYNTEKNCCLLLTI